MGGTEIKDAVSSAITKQLCSQCTCLSLTLIAGWGQRTP